MAELKLNNATITPESLFKKKDEPKPAPVQAKPQVKKPEVKAKQYILYFANPYDESVKDYYTRYEDKITRDQMVGKIIDLIDEVNQYSEMGYIDSCGMYYIMNESEIFCADDDNKFAKISMFNFLNMMKDVVNIPSESKDILKEFLELAEEGAMSVQEELDDDYDINDCQDVLNKQED